jgi:hypothetical protein
MRTIGEPENTESSNPPVRFQPLYPRAGRGVRSPVICAPHPASTYISPASICAMTRLRTFLRSAGIVAALGCAVHLAWAQADDAALQKTLKDRFVLTTTTADRSDIVTAGSVLTLRQSGLQMCGVAALAPMPNTYRNGKISVTFGDRMLWGVAAGRNSTNLNEIPQRTFTAGEKFWITDIAPQKDAVFLMLYSDPYNGLRYYAQLKIPYPKGSRPSAEDVMKLIAETVTMDTAAQNATAQPAPTSGSAPPPAQASEPAPAPIPPPPPPADAPLPAPPTVVLGQTKDQVLAILGQPLKVAKGATKEIDYYPDMKVIFVDGKVTDIQ